MIDPLENFYIQKTQEGNDLVSKLVEKCALKQFIQYCDDQNLILDYQSAYRSGYSTETALVEITNDILWSFEKQHASALIVMDLSATF